MLDAGIEQVLHVGQAGMSDDGAVAQGTRTPFHAPLEPADDAASGDVAGNLVQQLIAFEAASAQASILQRSTNAGLGKSGPQIGVSHDVGSRLLENGMVSVQSGADSEAFVTGGGLDPGTAKGRARENLAVGHTVERTAA